MKKLIVCGALAAFALGTQAASAAEFYICLLYTSDAADE